MPRNSPMGSFSCSLLTTTAASVTVVLLATAAGAQTLCSGDDDCDDGLFCTGVEVCSLAGTCTAVSACPPSIPPTVCNEGTDTCDPVGCTSDAQCDDGLFCTGAEACDESTGNCVVLDPCPPSIPPTACNEATDSCDPTCFFDSDCDDTVFCNGVESCNLETQLCVAVSACPPSIPPTVCNESTDTCDPAACTSDAQCDDGLFCTGVESCDLDSGNCVVLSPCPPSIPPTICNESTDTCDFECTSDADCNDGLFCTGAESCNLETGLCAAVSACPPSIPPTVCNESADRCDPALIFADGFESGDLSSW